jgi:hypothetical protein
MRNEKRTGIQDADPLFASHSAGRPTRRLITRE